MMQARCTLHCQPYGPRHGHLRLVHSQSLTRDFYRDSISKFALSASKHRQSQSMFREQSSQPLPYLADHAFHMASFRTNPCHLQAAYLGRSHDVSCCRQTATCEHHLPCKVGQLLIMQPDHQQLAAMPAPSDRLCSIRQLQ